ncbi:MAG: hypothetical protein CSA62_13730 [Planctomycetota bacterium]|nr:MAG: hypothetical protein CSA62_13730 [Planctomycetota bacterium]
MKYFAWILFLTLLPVAESQAQVRIGGGVTIRFGHGGTRIIPRVHIDIGGGCRGHRPAPPRPRCEPERPRGHYVIVSERVWVPPIYRYRRDRCGRLIRYCVRRGYWKTIERKVWVPAPPVLQRPPLRGRVVYGH